jgi:hypothetical protein
MRRIVDYRDPAGEINGLLQDTIEATNLKLNGHVAIDILDERGKPVVGRVEADNYVNQTMWNEFALALLKMYWSYGYVGDVASATNTTVTNNPYTNRDPRYLPTMRGDYFTCWTDTTAEDTTDKFAFGEVIAWAHRWLQAPPYATRQGVVIPLECRLTRNSVKWIYEWSTSSVLPGSFQSVGWRRINCSSGTGDPIIRDIPHISRKWATATGHVPIGNSATSTYMQYGTGSVPGRPVLQLGQRQAL